jgi:hypothetical protein
VDLLGEGLELRVRGGDGKVSWVRVVEHLTLGRSAASGVVIDDAGVNLIHARVVAGVGGLHELRCVGMAQLVLEDGTRVDRVDLKPGVSFRIGGVSVECVWVGRRVLNFERSTIDVQRSTSKEGDSTAGVQRASSDAGGKVDDAVVAVEMPRLVVCPTCYADMTGVSVVARFCPRCGVQLPARDGAGFLIPPEESSPLFPVYRALREELDEKLAGETPQVASSLIILAYANAMLNLGWRYEHGRGAMRNVEEAARCYAKAGRLVGR